MSFTPIGRRTTFTFYAETKHALATLEKTLQKQGIDADWTDIVRALVHGVSETEILARGLLLDLHERSPAGAALGVGDFVPFRINPDDYAKLERVSELAHRVGAKLSLGVLVRALAMSDTPADRLAELVQAFREKFPDGRAIRWQRRK